MSRPSATCHAGAARQNRPSWPRLTRLLLIASLVGLLVPALPGAQTEPQIPALVTGGPGPTTARMAPAQAYDCIAQGRPREALACLRERAQTLATWHDWYDAGRAAIEAGERPHAIAWLLRAHQLAPAAPEPRRALLRLGIEPPPTWLDRLGLWGRLTAGLTGGLALALGGAALGYAASARAGRLTALLTGCALLLATLPAQLALTLDAHGSPALSVVVHPSCLLSSTGRPQADLEAGTVIERLPRDPWSGRVLVRLADGRTGYVALTDLDDAWPPAR